MVDKGGCKVGKKAPEGSPKGGCKEGLKVRAKVAPKKIKIKKKAPAPAPAPVVVKPKKKLILRKTKPLAVKAKPKQTMGQSLTGLTKEQMNKLTPLELFGMLPVALSKVVLDPKTTGVPVGKSKISNITQEDLQIWELAPEDEDSNWWDSALYHEDFTGIMTPTQGKWYIKARLKGFDDLSRKDQDKWEGLEEKIMVGVGNEVQKHHTNMFREWKKKNKGMTGTLKEFKKSFETFYNK